MNQLSLFDMIPDPPKADGVTLRIKWASKEDPRKRGTTKIITTRKNVLEAVHQWREENKTKFYYLGHEED